MKKISIYWFLVDTIFLIVFNFCFFLIKGNASYGMSAWLSYGFIHFSYIILLLTPTFVRHESASSDYSRPLYLITATYFFAVLIIGIAFIIYDPEKTTFPLLVQVGILGVFSFIFLSNLIANEHTADSIERKCVELAYAKETSQKIKSIMGSFQSNEANKKIEFLYDYIHSSPVRSSPLVASIEQEIASEVDNLFCVDIKSDSEAISTVDKIMKLAVERNRILSNI